MFLGKKKKKISIKCCHTSVSVIVERGRFNYGPGFCPRVLLEAAVMEVTSHSALVLKAPFKKQAAKKKIKKYAKQRYRNAYFPPWPFSLPSLFSSFLTSVVSHTIHLDNSSRKSESLLQRTLTATRPSPPASDLRQRRSLGDNISGSLSLSPTQCRDLIRLFLH